MKKSNNIIMIMLIIIVLGLTGYIIYDKTLSTNNDENNYQENNNNTNQNNNNNTNQNNNNNNNQNNNNNTNQNNNNNNNEQNDGEDVYSLNTIKTYAGCSKQTYQTSQLGFEYAIHILEIKENNKCILYYGGIDGASSGSIMPDFDCTSNDSYITINNHDIPLYFKVNKDDTITYQNVNVVMKKIASPESANYNFCKNNY